MHHLLGEINTWKLNSVKRVQLLALTETCTLWHIRIRNGSSHPMDSFICTHNTPTASLSSGVCDYSLYLSSVCFWTLIIGNEKDRVLSLVQWGSCQRKSTKVHNCEIFLLQGQQALAAQPDNVLVRTHSFKISTAGYVPTNLMYYTRKKTQHKCVFSIWGDEVQQ